MNATRTLLVCHGVSIALIAWLLLREPPVYASNTTDVLAACNDIRRELSDLQVVVQTLKRELPRHEATKREEIQPGGENTAGFSSSSLDDLARSVRSLEAKISRVSTNPLNLDEIHQSYPTTNWAGWEAHKQRCGMNNEAIAAKLAQALQRERNVHHNSQRSKTRRKIEATLSKPVHLKRPTHILELFGSPNSIRVEERGLVWIYQSPDEKEWFQILFMHGFVKNLRMSFGSR